MLDNIKKWSKLIIAGILVIGLILLFRALKFSPIKFIGWVRNFLKPSASESNPDKADKLKSETTDKSIADVNTNAGKLADRAISNIDQLLEDMTK